MRRNKTAIIMAFFLIGILAMNMAMAEINLYGSNSVVSNNETKHSLYITMQDSGGTETGKKADTNISVQITHYNYTLANNVSILGCFLKEQELNNNYDTDGKLINTTLSTNIIYYNYSATSIRHYTMRDKDILQLDLHCFYDADVDNAIFQYLSESLVGLGAGADSHTCGACARGDFEEVINDYIEAQQTTEDQIEVYEGATNITNNVNEFWLMFYWTIRIFLMILLAGLIFSIGFWIYGFFQKMGRTTP